ncbi:MAG: hypothetical protein K2X47_15400 [Bdellovibrionales bacterium]|nr:hypothetical protein [Bdellovibrionales bacterium]
MKSIVRNSLIIFAVLASFILVIEYYSYIFAKTVVGEVIDVARVNDQTALIATGATIPNHQMFSFAIAVRGPDGQIVTASGEDRQWAVVQKGLCVEMKVFPYPPWKLDKAGTYFGARAHRVYDCPKAP